MVATYYKTRVNVLFSFLLASMAYDYYRPDSITVTDDWALKSVIYLNLVCVKVTYMDRVINT